MTDSGRPSPAETKNGATRKKRPSPEYLTRLRQEIREDKDGYYAREVAAFRDFLEGRGAGRETA